MCWITDICMIVLENAMDLRTEKSKKAITEAFLALRARRPPQSLGTMEVSG